MVQNAGRKEQKVRIQLPNSYEESFLKLEQIDQEQIIFDAWNRTLQDWQHQHFNEWRRIQQRLGGMDKVKIEGWESETSTAGVPDMNGIILNFGSMFTDIEEDSQYIFFKQFGSHIQKIIDSRFDC